MLADSSIVYFEKPNIPQEKRNRILVQYNASLLATRWHFIREIDSCFPWSLLRNSDIKASHQSLLPITSNFTCIEKFLLVASVLLDGARCHENAYHGKSFSKGNIVINLPLFGSSQEELERKRKMEKVRRG